MDRPVVAAIASALLLGIGVNACTSAMDTPAAQTGASAGGGPIAYAQLRDKDGNPKGRAVVRPMGDGVHLAASLENMPQGTYATHIHTAGRCDVPDFISAGPHWNPTNRKHGIANSAGPHKGDLPNVQVGAGGAGNLNAHIEGVAMKGQNALLDADGSAIIVHAGVDDNTTDPSGNSGARVACGVFTAG